MNTVPRCTGADTPSAEADALRALLAEIRAALDVPIDGCSPEEHHLLLTARAAAVRGAVMLVAEDAGSGVSRVGDSTDWLKGYVAEHAPLPAGTEGGTR